LPAQTPLATRSAQMIDLSKSTWRHDLDTEISRLEGLLSDLRRLRDESYPTNAELAAAPLLVNPEPVAIPAAAFVGLAVGHPQHGVKPVRTSAVEILGDTWFRSSNRIYRVERYEGLVQ